MLTKLTRAEVALASPPAALACRRGYFTLNGPAVEAIGTPRRVLVAADGRGLIVAPAPPGDHRSYSLTLIRTPNGKVVGGSVSIPVALRGSGLLPTGDSVKYLARVLANEAGQVGGLLFTLANTLTVARRKAKPLDTRRPRVPDLAEALGAGLR